MPRPMRAIALVAALALVILVPAGSIAGAQPSGGRVVVNAAMAPWGTTDSVGWATANIHQPTSWADPPGTYSFNGVSGTKHRNLIERVQFWPWTDEQGNHANWAFVLGYTCPFSTDGPPVCRQVAWAFVDYANTALRDFSIVCWTEDGIRPPGDTWTEVCDAPGVHQDWTQVVNGSIVVLLPR
jgi:hypothetical protein